MESKRFTRVSPTIRPIRSCILRKNNEDQITHLLAFQYLPKVTTAEPQPDGLDSGRGAPHSVFEVKEWQVLRCRGIRHLREG